MAGGKRDDQIALNGRLWRPGNNQTAVRQARERHDGTLDFAGVVHLDWPQLHTERRGHRLDDGVLANSRADGRIPKYPCSCYAGRDLFKQLKPFSAKAVLERRKSGRVAARTGLAINASGANRID